MKVLINLKNFFTYFLVIFAVSFLFYLVRMFGSYNILSPGNIFNYLHLFTKLFLDCFFMFSILSSALSILLISTGLKLRGGFSVMFTILVISLICFVYPLCMKYLGSEKAYRFLLGDNMELYSDVLDKDVIYNRNGTFIYVSDSVDYEYRDIIILDDYDIISSTYGSGTTTNLNLVDVSIFDAKKDLRSQHKNFDYRLAMNSRVNNARILDMFFALPLIHYFGALFSYFMNASVPIYVYAILYIALSVLLMGFYTLGAAMSANFMRFQNMTISFVVYILFILFIYGLATFISSKAPIEVLLHAANPLMVSILMLIGAFIVNALALLAHFFFRFDKYYK